MSVVGGGEVGGHCQIHHFCVFFTIPLDSVLESTLALHFCVQNFIQNKISKSYVCKFYAKYGELIKKNLNLRHYILVNLYSKFHLFFNFCVKLMVLFFLKVKY